MAAKSKLNPAYKMDDEEELDDETPAVTRQPSRREFRIYQYDDQSRQKIANLSHTHKRPKRLKAKVDETTDYTTRATEEKRQNLRSGMTYDQFMTGLLYADEDTLLRGQFLYYDKVQFVYEDPEVKNQKKVMKQGRAFLTNHRLLLLSNEELQCNMFSGVSLEKPVKKTEKERKKEEEKESPLTAVTDDLTTVDLTGLYLEVKERKPYVIDTTLPKSKRYAIFGYARDVVSYFSIPLGCIKNVEFDADIGTTAVSFLKGKKPCCCLRFCGCCGCNSCTKSWNEDWMGNSESNKRVLQLGVHLPPWGHKCYVKIFVNEQQKTEIVRDIIVDLQHYAPDLYSGKMVYRG